MKSRNVLCAGVLTAAMAFSGVGIAYAQVPDIATIQAGRVVDAAPDALEAAVPLTEADGVYAVSASGTSVEVSRDTDASIQLSSAEGTLNLTIDADITSVGAARDARSVSYQHANGDASVVNVNEDGSVRVTSLIEGAQSPEKFSYNYPGVNLVQLPDGGVVGYDGAGDLQVVVELPWAFDAAGIAVQTRYTVSGSTLTQEVDHADGDYAYPIAADPTSYGGNFMYKEIVRDSSSQGTIIRVYVGTYNFSHASKDAIFAAYKSLVPLAYEGNKYRDQLICHVGNIGALKSPWNLDSWRPDVGYTATVLALCNP